jgi:hypothetical protein
MEGNDKRQVSKKDGNEIQENEAEEITVGKCN